MIVLFFDVLATLILFGIILSYILALKMHFTRGILALLIYFIVNFVYMLLGVISILKFKFTNEVLLQHSEILAIITFCSIAFLFYTTWNGTNKLK